MKKASIISLRVRLHADRASNRRGLACVGQQIVYHLLYTLGIGRNGRQVAHFELGFELLFFQAKLCFAQGTLDHADDVHTLELYGQLARVDRCDADQIVEHTTHALNIGLHALKELPLDTLQLPNRLVHQQLSVSQDRGHRRAQILGQCSEEFIPGLHALVRCLQVL